ncbi:MAG: hypothetical protein QOH35_1961 [Acidobacteriaceae bacterium]|nr:hypothetical protein [Acidobacteriaceae bacterium]
MILGPGWASRTAKAGDTPLQRAPRIRPEIELSHADRGHRDLHAFASLTDSVAEKFTFRGMDQGMRRENFSQRRQGPARSQQDRSTYGAIVAFSQFSNNFRDRGSSQLTGRRRAVRQVLFLLGRFELSCEVIRLDGSVLFPVGDDDAPAIQ